MTEQPAYDFDSATWESKPESGGGGGGGGGVSYRQWLWSELDEYGNPMKLDVIVGRDAEGEPKIVERPFRVYRFFSDPGDAGVEAGHWFNVKHQVDAGAGLIDICDGKDMPKGCRNIPMMGWDDPIIDRVRPYRFNTSDKDTARARPVPVALGLFVDESGETRILEMSKSMYLKFIEELEKMREYSDNPDLSIAGRPVYLYKKGIKGKPGAASIALRLAKDSKLPTLEPGQFPQAIDLKQHLVEIRETIAAMVLRKSGSDDGEVSLVDQAEPSVVVDPDPDRGDRQDEQALHPALKEAKVEDFRAVLDDHEIPYAKNARRGTLIKLIIENELAGEVEKVLVPF